MYVRHSEILGQICELLASCRFLVWNADHGFRNQKLRKNTGAYSTMINGRRPDAVFQIGQEKYAVEVQTRILHHSDRLLAQLIAFSKAGYKIILVVPCRDLQTARIAIELQNLPDIYAIVELEGFKHLVLDLQPPKR